MRRNVVLLFLFMAIVTAVLYSCSKDDSSTVANSCAGVTITVTGTVTDAASGQSNGAIAASATGASGFTFKLNNGAFQSSGTFSNLAAGNYTITARSSNGCEGSTSFTVGSLSACNGVNISVTTAATNATPCTSPANGSLTVTATGSTGFTYSIDGSTFQTSNIFNNLAAGNYNVTVRNANSCSQTATATVGTASAGPLFSAVRSVLQTSCVGCHNPNNLNGGKNWNSDCDIVANSARIKARAVDGFGTSSQMPPPPRTGLSTADRQKILDWIAAGAAYTN